MRSLADDEIIKKLRISDETPENSVKAIRFVL